MLKAIDHFWRHYPALLFGLAIYLGWCASRYEVWPLIFPLLVLFGPLLFPAWIPSTLFKRLILALVAAISTFAYVNMNFLPMQPLPPEGVSGTARFEIQSVTSSHLHFGRFWVYKGLIRDFLPNSVQLSQKAHNLPCSITLPCKAEILRPPASRDYLVQGTLKPSERGHHLTPHKDTPWLPINHSWSLAECRFQAKQTVAELIAKNIKCKESADFLIGIATGNFEDRFMIHQFSRFGLQHIMAISGFHFAIIASILGILLRIMCSTKIANLVLIALLTGYFVFLGSSPSILRAWFTITLALLGSLIGQKGNGINSLGAALIVVMLWDPLFLEGIGFQFSFAATAAILMLYPACDRFLERVFVKRALSVITGMDHFNQHAYLILSIFRQALSLTIAVNLITLPMMLFHFHKFPLMSLIYNLFFPFMVSLSMLLLILAMLVSIVFASLGEMLHAFNSYYTKFVLDFTYNMPASVDVVWRVEAISIWLIVLLLSAALLLSIYIKYATDQRRESFKDLEYL